MKFKTGDYVQSEDERDDPNEVFIVAESGIHHVSGPTSKISAVSGRDSGAVYRLDANLRRVSIARAAYRYRLGA